MSRSAGARQRHDIFDYFGLFGYRAGTSSHTLDSSALAGPASEPYRRICTGFSRQVEGFPFPI